jgi:hypothetical protein
MTNNPIMEKVESKGSGKYGRITNCGSSSISSRKDNKKGGT